MLVAWCTCSGQHLHAHLMGASGLFGCTLGAALQVRLRCVRLHKHVGDVCVVTLTARRGRQNFKLVQKKFDAEICSDLATKKKSKILQLRVWFAEAPSREERQNVPREISQVDRSFPPLATGTDSVRVCWTGLKCFSDCEQAGSAGRGPVVRYLCAACSRAVRSEMGVSLPFCRMTLNTWEGC